MSSQLNVLFNLDTAAAQASLTNIIGTISRLTTQMSALSDEQGRLNTQSQRLNLDFDAAAGAAGRFVDETSAMTVATQFAARGINLTQTQLNDLMHVAGATAQTLGTDVAGEANNLAEALIRGRSNALAPFGASLAAVSGESHTVAERLTALSTRSGEVETATDNAATSMERFKDQLEDAERTFSHAFVSGLARMSTLGETTNQVSTDMAALNTTIGAAGHAAATVLTTLTLGVAGIGAVAAVGVAAVIDLVRIAASATGGVSGMRAEIARLNREGATVRATGGLEEIFNRIRAINSDAGGTAAVQAQSTTTRQAIIQTGEVIQITGAATTARHAHTAAIHAETAAQMRSGAETVRIAEQHRSDAANGVSLSERTGRAQELLTAAIRETTRASEAMEQAHQTPAQRSELVTALNGETAARRELAAAMQAQSQAAGDLAAKTHDMAVAHSEEVSNDQRKQNLDQQRTRDTERGRREQQMRLDGLAQQRNYGSRMKTLLGEEINARHELANATVMSFRAVGSALGAHAIAVVQGKEDIADGLQGMLKDVLTSIGSEAMIKGSMMMAEGLAALAGIVTAPKAAGNFAAGAAYFAVGAAATAAGAAVPPAASSITDTGKGGGGAASAATGETPMRSGGSTAAEAPSNITINMNAFQSNDQAQALIVRALREAGYRNIR